MLYYSLVYCRMQYGITAWATSNKTSQEIIWVGLNKILRIIFFHNLYVPTRDVEAETEAGCRSGGSGTFSVEAEARKIHRFRIHIGGKNGERKEIGSAIFCRRTNGGT